MNGLLFLKAEDFNVQRGTKGPVMCHGIPGFSLILFYSTKCVHCQTIIPIFKKLPGLLDGCQFGMVNIGTSNGCIEMSKGTIAEIQYVPYILLYINGVPLSSYKGEPNAENIRTFISHMATSLREKQRFIPPQGQQGQGQQGQRPQQNMQQQAHPQLHGMQQGIQGLQQQQLKTTGSELPTFGVPLCGNDKVCYLLTDYQTPANITTAYSISGGMQGSQNAQ